MERLIGKTLTILAIILPIVAIACIIVSLITTSVYAGDLTKQTVIDKMEVLQSGHVQVRQAVRVIENDKIISQQFHRYVVSPGDDYSKRDAKVKAVCEKVQTQAVIDAYKNSISENPPAPVVTPGLVKETIVSKLHILEDGRIVAITTTRVLDDGKQIGKSEARELIIPGQDYTTKAKAVKDVCKVIHTEDVINAYKAKHPDPKQGEGPGN